MKSIILNAPRSLIAGESNLPSLKEFEVRIKVKKTSICGSDIKNFYHPVLVPQIPGHEFSGKIVERTIRSQDVVNIGDRVTLFPMIGCMECCACKQRVYRDCESKLSIGFHLPGSFCEYINVDSRFVIPLDDEISYEDGALIEHLACGYRLVREMIKLKIQSNCSIVIIGDGPIALANIQLLKVFGFNNITLIGKHGIRMRYARKLGARHLFDYRHLPENLPLIDVCIFSAKADDTIKEIIKYMRPNAFYFPQTRMNDYLFENKKMTQFKWGRAFAYMIEDFKAVMDLVKKRQLDTFSLVTKRVMFDDLAAIQAAFFKKDHQIKTIISF